MAYPTKTVTRKTLFGGTVTKTKKRTPAGKTVTKVRERPAKSKATPSYSPRMPVLRGAQRVKATTIVRTKKVTPKVKVVKSRPAPGKKGKAGLLRHKTVKATPRKVERKRIKY